MRLPHGLPRRDTLSFRRDSAPSPSDWRITAKHLPGFLRLLAGLAILSAVVGQFVFTAGRAAIDPFNLFWILHDPQQHHHDGRLLRLRLLHPRPQDATDLSHLPAGDCDHHHRSRRACLKHPVVRRPARGLFRPRLVEQYPAHHHLDLCTGGLVAPPRPHKAAPQGALVGTDPPACLADRHPDPR